MSSDGMFYGDLMTHASNIKVRTSTVWKAAVLVLLKEGIYEVHYTDGLRRHNINITKIQDSRLRKLSHTINNKQKQTPWPQSTSELYRPSDRHLSAKLVPTLQIEGVA
jgi:hypothetical protein